MVNNVPPSNPPSNPSSGNSSNVSSSPSGKKAYHAQYKVSPEFRKFWNKLFQHAAEKPTDDQLKQMTDQFTKNIWDSCNQVLQWALEQQKQREQDEKENDG